MLDIYINISPGIFLCKDKKSLVSCNPDRECYRNKNGCDICKQRIRWWTWLQNPWGAYERNQKYKYLAGKVTNPVTRRLRSYLLKLTYLEFYQKFKNQGFSKDSQKVVGSLVMPVVTHSLTITNQITAYISIDNYIYVIGITNTKID